MPDIATRNLSIAVDTGGTFTDLVVSDESQVLGLYKALTTPDDLLAGIKQALEQAAGQLDVGVSDLLGASRSFVYSTTHSTNAILEGKTARTAFLTTRGNPDILAYKEGGKDQVHNWAIPFPPPYIPRRLTFEVTERILADGTVAVELDEAELERTMRRLAELDVEAVGVCLLWSTVNSSHEVRVGELLEAGLPDVEFSLSHRVNGIIREYRRASATVIDASLKPLIRRHLVRIEEALRELGFRGEPLMVTHVSGGVLQLDQMIERPVQTIDSGPALAPIAGIAVQKEDSREAGKDLIVVDTGGTSFDAGLVIDGNVAITREKWFGPKWYGHMTGLPAVDTRSIGSGGGSIAYVDAGGLLRVGPQSAGADPGPVSYDRGGTEPTVTDAAVVLGYLDPDNFLDGRMTLNREGAATAIATHIAEPLGISTEAAADAILTIASEEMRGLLIDLTITQGRDIRNCLMVAGGGAAGLNICRIAREAGIGKVLVPRLAAGLCAVGGLHSDIMAVFSTAFHAITSDFDYAGVNGALATLKDEMSAFERNVKVDGERSQRFLCEARYEQEMWEIDVALGDEGHFAGADDVAAFQAQFDANHLDLFATEQPGAPIEIITWRGEIRIARKKPNLALHDGRDRGSSESADTRPGPEVKPAWFSGEAHDTPVFRAADIPIGSTIRGPAIITEPTTTIVVIPEATVHTHPAHYTIEID